jgi:hypothetical protein
MKKPKKRTKRLTVTPSNDKHIHEEEQFLMGDLDPEEGLSIIDHFTDDHDTFRDDSSKEESSGE